MTGPPKFVGLAVVAALMGACLVGIALLQTPARMAADELSAATPAAPVDRLRLAHCRTLTAPDAGCAEAWDAEHRRFFRDDRR
ncbi:putative entry exclusion protein TrbK-alt [Sphingomonas lycopersici]|uniref:putative entry exclusion protein TrbK-alt n=1 Tax=Sphingomonas lycopersici TaxID=2951807 RepID=UPI003D78FFBA